MKQTRILFLLLAAFLIAPCIAWADSCPCCGQYYGDAMPGDEGRIDALRAQHEAVCCANTGGSSSSSSSSGSSMDWEMQREWQRVQEATRLNDIGVKYHNKGDFKTAISYYEQAASYNSNDWTIQNNLQKARASLLNLQGNAAYGNRDWQAAIKAYKKALEFTPNNKTILQNLSNAEYEWQEAERVRQIEEQKQRTNQKIKSKLAGFAQDFEPTEITSGLAFSYSEDDLTDTNGAQEGQAPGQQEELTPMSADDLPPVPLDKFENMKPSQMLKNAKAQDRNLGGNKTASAQAQSIQQHSQNAVNALSPEEASDQARQGFDTPGMVMDGLAPIKLSGIPAAERDPIIPEGQETPEIRKFVKERTTIRAKRKKLEKKLETMKEEDEPDLVEMAKAKDEISRIEQKEVFLNFSITRELKKPSQNISPENPAPSSDEEQKEETAQ